MMGLRSVSSLLLLVAFAAADCPAGTIFESTFNKCYKFFNTPSPFLAAEQKCNSIGGNLVAIQNAYENSYVSGIVSGAAARTPNYWIGANLLLTTSWSWTAANASFSYANWANGQPISSNPCGLVRDLDSKWLTGACNSPLPFVCAVDPNASVPGTCPTQSPPPTCSPSTCSNDAVCTSGYTLFPGNCMCYKYFTDYKNFTAANVTCAQNGGILASSTSADVNKFLTALPQADCRGYSCPYIGLTCTSSSLTTCKWADGSSLGNYTNFYYGVPSSVPYSYVIVTALNTGVDRDLGQWEPTSDSRTYICQKPSTRASLLMQSPSEEEQRKGGKIDIKMMSSAVDNN